MKKPIYKNWWFPVGILVVLLIIGGIVGSPVPPSNDSSLNNVDAESGNSTQLKENAPVVIDTASLITKELETIKAEIQTLKEGVNFSEYSGELNKIEEGSDLLASWRSNLSSITDYGDKNILKAKKELKSLIIAMHNKQLPALRKYYAELCRTKFWESNVDVRSSGSGNRTLTFTGGIFADNANIKAWQTPQVGLLDKLRFSKVCYKWYSGDDQYTYYDLDNPKDSDVE